MKKQKHILIAITIVACWVIFVIAFSFGKLQPASIGKQSAKGMHANNGEADEIASPFSLKAVSTFLLQ